MSLKTVQVAPELTRAALRYENKNMMARKILPPFMVADEDGLFMKELSTIPFTLFDRTERGDHSIAHDITEVADTGNYLLEGFGLKRFVSDREKRRAKNSFQLWLSRVGTRLEGALQLRYEVQVASIVFDGTNFAAGNKGDPAIKWDVNTAAIIEDILAARENVDIKGDLNALAINDVVFNKIRTSESFKEIMALNSMRAGTRLAVADEVMSILELDFLFVSNTKFVNAAGTLARVWGDNALLFAVDPANSFTTPVLGNSFTMTGEGFQNGIKGVQYRDMENRGMGGTWWEVNELIDPILYTASSETTIKETGHLFTNVLT